MASRMSKRFTGLLGKSKGKGAASPVGSSADDATDLQNAPVDSPEYNIARNIRLFCESGSTANRDEEVLHLPVIVDAAESSPAAAASATRQIRIFLSRDWAVKPHVQYNAIMLIRILSDHPGPIFTRNFDKTFVSTIKEALRNCRDSSTQQILRETLDQLEANKQYQEGMEGLIQMWRKEKGSQAAFPTQGIANMSPPGFQNGYGQQQPPRQNGGSRGPRPRQLPAPVELASRIEEARNTAKILLQLIQSTPSDDILNNDLLREFAERCQSAQRSMQGFIDCDGPPPDDETMLTLIETNEQLSLAGSRYQRSLLNARKAAGISPSPGPEALQNTTGAFAGPPPPQSNNEQNLFTPPQSPPRQPANPSAFGGSGTEDYQAPLGPPPRQATGTSAFSNPADSFSAPPNPPQSMLARLNSREGQSSPPQPEPIKPSDPFADPVEHEENPAPLAYDFNDYSHQCGLQNATSRGYPQAFNVDAGPTYAPGHVQSSSIEDDDPYASSPIQTRNQPWSASSIPPVTQGQSRPYNAAGATPSYLGRQTSAGDDLTMHGAQTQYVSEIDGHSEVGRTNQPSFRRANTAQSDAGNSAYGVTPM